MHRSFAQTALQTAALLLLMLPTAASAQSGAAVVPASVDGEAAPEFIAAVERTLDDGSRWVMPSTEVIATLTTAQKLGGDETKVQLLMSQMQKGVDAYYDDRLEESEQILEESINNALSQPLQLVFSPRLAEQAKEAMLILPRVYLANARFDEAAAVTRRLVEVFPVYIPSRKQYPPNVVDMVEQSRVQHTSLGKRLLVETASGQSCAINVNGDEILLEGDREIPVATASYAVLLKCGDAQAGPFLVNMDRVENTIVVTAEVIGTLSEHASSSVMVMPAERGARDDLAATLLTTLGTEQVYMTASGGDGIILVRLDEAGYRAATTSAEPTEYDQVVPELLIAIDHGEPIGEIAVDVGSGWERSEQRSYLIEYIVMGVGGATVVVGGIMLALAASQGDVVRDCQNPGVCDAGVAQDNADLYAQNLFTGQLLLGLGSAIVLTGATVFLVRFLTAPDGADQMADGPGFMVGPQGAMATWRLTW